MKDCTVPMYTTTRQPFTIYNLVDQYWLLLISVNIYIYIYIHYIYI